MAKRKEELQELFSIATDNPQQAQEIIEGIVQGPYTRAQADNLTIENINKLKERDMNSYYKPYLYRIWNYAEKLRKQSK